MAHAFPMMLDVTARPIVIVGGGAVAARKARVLLDAGATRIACVSPTFCNQLPQAVRRVQKEYGSVDLDGTSLVFAATNRTEVNEQVVRDAHARGLLVNRADADENEPGDFATPALLLDGDLRIAVSAGSPALAALIRDQLRSTLDPAWSQMAAAMQTLRPRITASGLGIHARRQIFRQLAGEEALGVLKRRGSDGLEAWLRERHPELKL